MSRPAAQEMCVWQAANAAALDVYKCWQKATETAEFFRNEEQAAWQAYKVASETAERAFDAYLDAQASARRPIPTEA